MNKTRIIAIIAGILAGASLVLAEDAAPKDKPPEKAAAPADKKADGAVEQKPDKELEKKIADLIKKFCDKDARTYSPARNELRQIGKPALPQLEALEKDSEKNGERSLVSRAKSLIRNITNPPQPGGVAVARIGVGGAAVGGGLQNLVPGTVPPPAEATSLDLLDSFGARFGESADGVRVTDLKAASFADKLGLNVGDIVSKVNSRQLSKLEEAREAFAKPAESMRIEVQRQGKPLTLSIKP